MTQKKARPAPAHKPVLALMGPTAAGKTAIAMRLVARFDMEIVSVDSAMVYRGMDVGTAKPDGKELAHTPHRLVDICAPSESYSAGRFRRDALAAIGEIHAAGRVPLLVGGTMLYFRALFDGIDDLPDADPAIRAAIDARAAIQGWPGLHKDLRAIDPRAAARIHPNDRQRIQRALEVYRQSGVAISDWHARRASKPFPYRLLKIALIPGRREVLYERIAARFAQMLEAGLLAEVRRLLVRGDSALSASAMRAVGYRQLAEHLAGRVSLDEAMQNAITASRRLAKRQLTWLRGERGLTTIDPLEDGAQDKIINIVAQWGGTVPPGLC